MLPSRPTAVLVLLCFALIALGQAVSPARAAEYPVSYLVEAKALSTLVSGDSLTFELYSDAACSTLVHSESVMAGTDALIVEQIRQKKLKDQDPKPIKAIRLLTVLSPATVADQFYLVVTGTGVTPVGTSCQVVPPTPLGVPDGAITGAKLAAGAVTSDKVAAGAIGTSDIANGSVTAAKLAADATSKLVSSIDGVTPASGDVDLVAGSNVTISPNPVGHSITIESSPLTLPYSATVSSAQPAFEVTNTGTSYGIEVTSTSSYGVRASSGGSSGYGLYGLANGDSGRGVVGSSGGVNGYGVWGYSAQSRGVYGSTVSGTGVYGKQTTSGNIGTLGSDLYGVYGEHGTAGSQGWLGSLDAGASGQSEDHTGVHGASINALGVLGESQSYYGVRGQTSAGVSSFAGVYGVSTATAAGVRGYSVNGHGVYGESPDSHGVHGKSASGSAIYSEGDLDVTGAFKGNIAPDNGAPFPRPAFNSGWVDMPLFGLVTLTHDIGGDVDDYVVDLQFKNDEGMISNVRIGGDHSGTIDAGAWWHQLTNTEISVSRGGDEGAADFIRVRIWVIR